MVLKGFNYSGFGLYCLGVSGWGFGLQGLRGLGSWVVSGFGAALYSSTPEAKL